MMEWAPIIGAVGGAVAGGLISLVGTHLLGGKLVAYRLEINSRMDEYIKEIKTAARLTGANEARQEARQAAGEAAIAEQQAAIGVGGEKEKS